jgi:hypothetical protein
MANGRAYEVETTQDVNFALKGYVQLVVGRTYRATASVRQSVTPASLAPTQIEMAFFGMDFSFASTTIAATSVVPSVAAGSIVQAHDYDGWIVVGQDITITAANLAAWARPYVIARANAGSKIQIKSFKFEDITVSAAAEGSAQAAADFASSASTFSDAAGNAAAQAASSATLSASVGLGSMLLNPTFSAYGNTDYPDSWTFSDKSGNAPTRVLGKVTPFAMTLTGDANGQSWISQDVPAAKSLVSLNQYCVIEADITLTSGALTGGGVMFRVYGGTTEDIKLNFSTDVTTSNAVVGTGTVGQTYSYRKLVQVTQATGAGFRVYAMAHWTTLGAITSANAITFHRVSVRPASQSEIEARVATANLVDLTATVNQQSGVIADLGGRTKAYWNLGVNAGSGAAAFITASAETAPGVTTSNVSIGAQEFHIYNQSTSGWSKALSVVNNEVQIFGRLQISSVTADRLYATGNTASDTLPATLGVGGTTDTLGSVTATANTVSTGTLKYRTAGAPTNAPVASGITVTQNSNGTMNVTVAWNAYVQGTKQADVLMLFWTKTNALPTINDASITMNVNVASGAYYVFEGVNPQDIYSFGLAAARRTESGNEVGTIVSPTSAPSWRNVGNTTPTYTASIGASASINGVVASTVTSGAASGATAFTGTAKYRTAGAPTNTITPSGLTIVTNTNGTINIRLEWNAYVQGANQADSILIFWRKDGTTPTVADSSITCNVNTASGSYYMFEGINPADTYSFGVASARRTEAGLEVGAIVSPASAPTWKGVGALTVNYTANVNGVTATVLTTNAANGATAYTGTSKYRTAGAPTNTPVPAGLTQTSNSNGTTNIRLDWSAYVQGTNQADTLVIFWRKDGTAPTVTDAAITCNVNTTGASYYIFEGVNPADTYSFGVAAARRTESGLEVGTIQSPASAPTWRGVGNTTPNFTANIGGTAAGTVVTNAASGNTAFTGTAKYRTAGAPTNNPAPTGITLVANTNGTTNIRLDWGTYVQGVNQSDTLIIFWRKDGTAPTITDSAVTCNVNTTGASYYVFEGVNPADTYSFGIAAARRTESGLEVGTIQSPASAPSWKAVSNTTPNFTANINGVAASTVTSNAANGSTAYTATAKYRTPGAPTNSATPTAITITQNNNGTMNVRLDWGVYTQGTNQADFLMVFWTKSNALPTLSDTSMTLNVNTVAAAYYVFEGISPQDIYSFGIAAVRRTESGLEISAIVSPTTTPNWRNIGNITPNYSANIGGTSAGTVATGAAGGATALAGTANYRNSGVPTNNAVPTGVTVTTNTNGTLNIRLDWAAYVQGAKQADTLVIFWRKDGTVPTFTDSAVTMNVNTVGPSYYILEGVNPADTYSFGISAARRTENGLEEGVIVSPTTTPDWQGVGNLSVNYTGNISGATASTVVANSVSGATAYTGTLNYRTSGAPTTIPTPAGIIVTTNTNGTLNIRLDWAAYVQGANQADNLLIFWRKDGNAPGINDTSIVCNVSSLASYYVFEGVNPADTYSFAIAAARRTENGLEVGSLQSPSTAPAWRGVGNQTPNFTANVNGIAALTVTTNATNGAAAYTGTAQYRTSGAPTNVPTPSALTITQNSNGTSNIRLDWSSYAQGAKQADTLVIFWRKDGTAPTVTDSAITCNVNTAGASYYMFEGVNPADTYSFGIAAGRRTELGLEVGTIASPTATPNWRSIGNVTPNYTANIGGTTAGTVVSNASTALTNASTALTGTANYRNTGVPTNAVVPTGITVTTNTNGTLNLRLDWAAYVQGAKQADNLVIFWRKDATTPTFNDSSVTVNVGTGASYYIFEGVNPSDTYSFGISASRRTENGLEEGAIVSPTATPNWHGVGNQTVNYTGNIGGATAAVLIANAANGATAFTGTAKYRTAGAPTTVPLPTGITLVTNTNATTNIRLDWGAYTQGVNQADNLIIFWRKDGTTPTIADASIVCNVSATASYYVFEGVNPTDTYSFGIAAARRTESGLEIGTIAAPTTAPNWKAVGAGTANFTANLNGVAATTVVTNAGNGATAYTGTTNYRTSGAPTNSPVPSALTINQNTNGTSNIRIDWSAYVQGVKQADTLVIFWRKDGTAPSSTDSAITCNVNTAGASYYIFEGVNPQDLYSFGIAAARRTELGLEVGTIVSPTSAPNWKGIGNVTPNFTANVGGTAAGTVVSNASTALTGTANYRNTGAPTNNAVPSGITVTTNTNGSLNLRLDWAAYVQGAKQADNLVIFWRKDGTVPTFADSSVTVNVTATASYYMFEGVNPADTYSFGIAAARRTENGVEQTAIVSPTTAPNWRGVGNQTVNYTGNISGAVASTVVANSTSGAAAFTGTVNYRTTGAPTTVPTPSGITVITNTNGTSNIRLDWSAYSQGANQADSLLIFWRKDATAPTIADASIVCNVTTTASYYVFEGINAADIYSFGIAAARRTELGLEVGTIASPASAPAWKNVSNQSQNYTANIGGSTAAVVVSNAVSGATAYTGTVNYRTTGAPTNNPTPSSLTITQNTNGTANIRLDWSSYVQGAKQADTLVIFWRKDATVPAQTDSAITCNVNVTGASYYVFEGVNPQDIYSFGIAAARRTESGLEVGTIQSPTSAPNWRNIGNVTPNYTANVGGSAASSVVANAVSGATAFTGTLNYRLAGAPTNNIAPSGITITTNSNATINITITWAAYVQGAAKADTLVIFWRKDANTPLITDSAITCNVNTTGASYYSFEGVNPKDIYSFGVAAARRTDNGLEIGAIVTSASAPSWKNVGNLTANYTANIGGSDAATVVSNAALGASDPATRINVGTTTIDPGKIVISGTTLLSDWRNGTDATTIEGGKIAANTISANKLTIGTRGIDISGLEFTSNWNGTATLLNRIYWSAGSIIYTDTYGVVQTVTLPAPGYYDFTSSIAYIYWVPGATALSTTTVAATAYSSNTVVLATYAGGTNMNVTYGRTIIDGSQITTGTIDANRLKVNSILSQTITVGGVSGSNTLADAFNRASYASVSGTPTSLAAINSTEGTKLTGIAAGATVGATSGTNLYDGTGVLLTDTAIKNSAANYNARIFYGMESNPGLNFQNATGVFTNGTLTLTATNGDPIINTPVLNTLGSLISLIRVRARPLSPNPTWDGVCYYNTAAHPSPGGYYVRAANPGLVQNQWYVFEYDMSKLSSAGGDDYLNSIITIVRFDFANSQQDWEIDWISFGAPVVAGSYVGGTLASSIESQTLAATAAIAAVASDNVLAIGEKGDIIMEKARIDQSYANLSARADALTVPRTAMNAAYSALNTYLATLSPAWNSVTTNTTIDGPTFRSKFTDFYTQETALASATTGAAATTATWTNVTGTGKPVDNATQNRVYNQLTEPTGVVDGDQWVYPAMDSFPSDLSGTTLPATVTLTRATTATRTNANGVIVTEALNVPRFDYDASKARTNYVTNSEYTGWTVAAPGVMTGGSWTASGTGLTRQTTEVGQDAAGRYATFRISGTNTDATTAYPHLKFVNNVTCVPGQVWTGSYNIELVAGSWTGIGGQPFMQIKNASTISTQPQGVLQTNAIVTATVPSDGILIDFGILMAIAPNVPVDVTFRIRRPQLEVGATLTAYIPTTGITGSVIDGAPRGLLDEPVATNLTSNGAAPLNWGISAVTRALAGFEDPMGSPAYKFTNTVGSGSRVSQSTNSFAYNTIYTRSMYVKYVSGSFNFFMESNIGSGYVVSTFNIATGVTTTSAGSTSSMTKVAAGWWLCTSTFTTAATGNASAASIYMDAYGNAGSTQTLAMACHQVEVGARTSFIPTTNAVLSRAADIASVNVGSFGLPDGSASMNYVFDDASKQTISSPVTNGQLIIPNLNRAWLKSATATVSKTVTRSRVGGAWVDSATVGAPAGTYVGSMIAENVVGSITSIASDNILSTNEKGDVIKEFDRITKNKDSLVARGAALLTPTTALVTAFTALQSHLTGLTPAWSNTSQNTPIDGPTFRQKFSDYYAQEATTASALTAAAATLASWSGVTGLNKPADNAGANFNLVSTGPSPIDIQGNSASRSATSGGFTSIAATKEYFVGSAVASFTMSAQGMDVGLTTNATPTTREMTSYTWHYSTSGGWRTRNGTTETNWGTTSGGVVFSTATQFSVVYDGTKVCWYADGVVIYQVTANPSLIMRMVIVIANAGATAGNLQFGSYTDNAWVSVGGLNKPADNATVGAPTGTSVAGMLAENVVAGINAVASDNVLSTNEKGDIIKEFDRITKNKDSLVARGAALLTSTTGLVTAFTALSTYLTSLSPAWNLVTANTTIDGPSFRTKFSDYYAQESTTASALTAAAATLATWTGVTGAAKPADNATVGAPAGTNVAGVLAETVISNINNIASDNVLSTNEKGDLIKEFDRITNNKNSLIARGSALQTTTTGLSTAFSALSTYLTSLSPAWNLVSSNTTIDGPTFRQKFSDYYAQESTTASDLTAAAATLASWTGVTGINKPADNATVGAPAGTYVGSMLSQDIVTNLTNITSDNVLSTSEKNDIIIENNRVQKSATSLINGANDLGLPTTAIGTALNALQNYLNSLSPAWDDVTQNTTIDGATFRSKFTDFYTQESITLAAINAKAATVASWDGVTGTTKPQDNATVGAPAGTYVGTMKAEDLIASIGAISSDNILSTSEKGDIVIENNRIGQSNAALVSRGGALGVSVDALSTAYAALQAYLTGLSPTWSDVTQNSAIDGPTFRQKFTDFYTQESATLSAITAKAATIASWDGVTGPAKPADYATVGAPAGTYVGTLKAEDLVASISAIASDSVLSTSEKGDIVLENNRIGQSNNALVTRGTALGVSTSALTTAYNALQSYLSGLTPTWSDVTQNTPIDGPTFRQKFTDFYTQESAVLSSITAAAATLASWSGVTGAGRPSDNATSDLTLYAAVGTSITVLGNSVWKPTGVTVWDTFVMSRESFVTGAAISFTLPISATLALAGLCEAVPTAAQITANNTYAALNYAVYRDTATSWRLFENGGAVVTLGAAFNGVTFSVATVWTITYDGVNAKYYADGVLMRTVAAVAGKRYFAGISLGAAQTAAVVNNIRFTNYTDNTWASVGGVNRPADNATVGAPAGTSVGGVLAETLVGNVNAIASDNVLSSNEKSDLIKEWARIDASKTALVTRGTALGVSVTGITNTHSALSTYLTSLSPAWNSTTTNTTIDGPTFRTKFTDFYTQESATLSAITQAAATLATWSGVTGAAKPADYATAGESIIIDQDFSLSKVTGLGTYWTGGSGMSIDPVAGLNSTPAFKFTANSTVMDSLPPNYTTCVGGDVFYIQAQVFISTDFVGSTGSLFSATSLNNANVMAYPGSDIGNITTKGSWVTVNGKMTMGSDAVKFKPRLSIRNDSTAGYVLVNSVTYQRVQKGATVGAPTGTMVGTMLAQDISTNITNITSDSTVSKGAEKSTLISLYNTVGAAHTAAFNASLGYTAKGGADITAAERTASATAMTALTTYLNGLTPVWTNVAVDTPIVGATLRTLVNNASTATQNLVKANAVAAAGTVTSYNSRLQRIADPIPSVLPISKDGLNATLNSDGSADVAINWVWVGDQTKIDGFEVTVHVGPKGRGRRGLYKIANSFFNGD